MERFINPYNFISLSDKPGQSPEAAGEKKYTGSITYSLTTRTPLFIPNTSSRKAFLYIPDKEDDPKNEHELYDFFSYNILDEKKTYDNKWFQPVIPGSEARGMIRSIYETLTNSCLSVLDGEKRIGKRTAEHFKAAVLKRKNGRIYLYDVVDKKKQKNGDAVYRDTADFSVKKHLLCKCQDGGKVSFTLKRMPDSAKWYIKRDVEEISEDPGKYPRQGYLLKGNQGKKHSPDIASNSKSKCDQNGKQCVMLENKKCPGKSGKGTDHCYLAEKHCAHVLYISDETPGRELDKASLGTLRIVLDQYLKEDPQSYGEYEDSYQKFIDGKSDGLPVFYSSLDDSDYIMLSPACITREVYKNTINSLVDVYKKCNSKERKLCPACSLFGITNSNVAQGSRLRFTDLAPARKSVKNADYYMEDLLTLAPLAVPHLQNTEFYLKKPIDPDGEVWFWTYDYYTVKKKGGEVVVKSYQPKISGRKFYWNNCSGVERCDKKTAINKTVRAVRPQVEFTGKIYFDEISGTQLKQLIYILTYTSDGKHGYKMGTGKPLGLGSVELSVKKREDLLIRTFNKEGYSCAAPDPSGELDFVKIRNSSFKILGLDKRVEKPFELITRYLDQEDMKKIRYPKTGDKEEEEGFQWFMANKINYKLDKKNHVIQGKGQDLSPKSRRQTKIRNELPDLDRGEIPWLPANDRGVDDMDGRLTGMIKFFDEEKGYGYISVENSPKNYKVSINKHNPDLYGRAVKQGCRVTFVPKKLGDKYVADECRLAE